MVMQEEISTATNVNPLWERFASYATTNNNNTVQSENSPATSCLTQSYSKNATKIAKSVPPIYAPSLMTGSVVDASTAVVSNNESANDEYSADDEEEEGYPNYNDGTACEFDDEYDDYDNEEDDGITEGNESRTTNTFTGSKGGDTATLSSKADDSIVAVMNVSRFKEVSDIYYNQPRNNKNTPTTEPIDTQNSSEQIARAVVATGTNTIYNSSSNSCYVTESLCGFGYDATKSRQLDPSLLPVVNSSEAVAGNSGGKSSLNSSKHVSQQQRNNLKHEIRELRQRNYQLYHQNRLLLEEKSMAHDKSVAATTGSDSKDLDLTTAALNERIRELQKRCEDAEYRNVQYEKEKKIFFQYLPKSIESETLESASTSTSPYNYTTTMQPRQQQEIVQLQKEPQSLKDQQRKDMNEEKELVLDSNPNELIAIQMLLKERDATIAALCEQMATYQQQQVDIINYKNLIVELEQQNQHLEVEVQEAVSHVDHTKEYCHDVVSEIEAKYSAMEHRLLQTKLELAAVNESKDQITEEYQASLHAVTEQNELLRNQLAATVEEKELLATELKRSLAETFTTKESLVAATSEHIETLTSLRSEVTLLQTERSDLKEVADRLKLKEDAQETIVEQLRKKLESSQKTVHTLQSQINAQVLENSVNRGTVPATDDFQRKIDELNTKVKLLKKRLYVTKNENSRFRAQLITKSRNNGENFPLSSDNWKLNESSDDTAETVDIDEDETSECTALSSRRLLKERDDAISSLVRQAMEQDQIIGDLRREIELYKVQQEMNETNIQIRLEDSSQRVEDSNKLVQQLRQEAEVFAGQVIELDGDIAELKSLIIQYENKILDLENQLKEAAKFDRSIDTSTDIESKKEVTYKILDLEAEIDELKEANLTQRNELRDLRRKMLHTESTSDDIVNARNETNDLKIKVANQLNEIDELQKSKAALLEELTVERCRKSELEKQFQREQQEAQKVNLEKVISLEKKLDEIRWQYDELKASPVHMSEDAVTALREELDTLRQCHSCQTEELRLAKSSIQELEEMLAEKCAQDAAGFEEEKEELFAEIESLTLSLNRANEKIQLLEADKGIINDFKEKLERADEAREASEKSIVETFERRISLLTLDKDVTIDKLRKELVIEKESTAEEMEGLVSQLKEYQLEISEIREEMNEQIEHRDARIYALEATLTAQEQLVSNMKTEMDHLQSSMENSVARRKDEIDEMQQELLTRAAAAAKSEREITSLRVEMDGKTLEYQATILKLEQKIAMLEKAPTELRNAQDLQMELRVKEVKDRLEKLKWRNTALKDENVNLRERLEQAENLVKSCGYSDRVKDVEEELAKQILKVKLLESAHILQMEVPEMATDAAHDDKTIITRGSSHASPIMEVTEKSMSSDSDGEVTASIARLTESLPLVATKTALTSATTSSSPSRPPLVQRMSAPSPPRRGLKLFGRKETTSK